MRTFADEVEALLEKAAEAATLNTEAPSLVTALFNLSRSPAGVPDQVLVVDERRFRNTLSLT